MKIIKYKKYIARLLVVTVSIMLIIGSVPASALTSYSSSQILTFGRTWFSNSNFTSDSIYNPMAWVHGTGEVAFTFSSNNVYSPDVCNQDLIFTCLLSSTNGRQINYNSTALPECRVNCLSSNGSTIQLHASPLSKSETFNYPDGSAFGAVSNGGYVVYRINANTLFSIYSSGGWFEITSVTFVFDTWCYNYYSISGSNSFAFGLINSQILTVSSGGNSNPEPFTPVPDTWAEEEIPVDSSNWFTEALSNILNNFIIPIKNAIGSVLNTVFNDFVLPFAGAVGNAISDILASFLPELTSSLTTSFRFTFETVFEPLLSSNNIFYQALTVFLEVLKPALRTITNELITPLLNEILLAINNVVSNSFSALSPLYSQLINTFTPFFNALSTTFVNATIDLYGRLEPLISNFVDSVTPSLLSIVQTLTTNFENLFLTIADFGSKIFLSFAPALEGITTILTNGFTDLLFNLRPIVDEFVTKFTPSFSNISNTIVNGFNESARLLFIPSQDSVSSAHYTEFKTEFESKFPIFGQLKTFLTTLFNPLNYSAEHLHQYTVNLVSTFEGEYDSTLNEYVSHNFDLFITDFNKRFRYCISDELLPLDTNYILSFDVVAYTQSNLTYFVFENGSFVEKVYNFVPTDEGKHKSFTFSTNSNKPTFLPRFYKIQGYSSNPLANDMRTAIQNITISFTSTSIESITALSSDFLVDVYGKKVSILDFSWYLPYKHYGDICILAFCYLAFVWHTFKKIPSFI